MADNALKRWWKTGSFGHTDLTMDNKTLIKIGVFIFLIFMLIYFTRKTLNKKFGTK